MALLTRLAALAALAATPAAAHVVADPAEAKAGAYQVVRFRVGHGCDGQATSRLSIAIPPGMPAARPQPKPGWKLSIAREGAAVSAITWEGELPEGQFDEFAVMFRLPAEAGELTFPVTQTCGSAQVLWDQRPSGPDRPPRPAPTLRLTPAAAGGHHHSH